MRRRTLAARQHGRLARRSDAITPRTGAWTDITMKNFLLAAALLAAPLALATCTLAAPPRPGTEAARPAAAATREAASAIDASAPRAGMPAEQPSDDPAFTSIARRAEELERAGSWELAWREWRTAETLALSDAQARTLAFRRADCRWRSLASTADADDTELVRARQELERLQAAITRPELRDETWVRIEESLGDFFWLRQRARDWGQAWQHYALALDGWAGARDVELARARYLGIVWRVAWPADAPHETWYARQLPLEVLENARAIAETDRDKARAHYLYALAVRWNGGDFARTRRGFAALESAIALGRGTPWYDDALLSLAQWHESPGAPDVDENGQWISHPDYVRALELYRRFTQEFSKGDVPGYDAAREAIERITHVELSVAAPCAFLPGSEQSVTLGWRNTSEIELELFRVELTRAVAFAPDDARGSAAWLDTVKTAGLPSVRRWKHGTGDTGLHAPGSAELALAPALAPGAYLLEARSGGHTARELVLVGRTLLTLKAAGERAVVWCCDALTSEPVAGARVVLHERRYDAGRWVWRRVEGTSGADGTFATPLEARAEGGELLACAESGERAAFTLGERPYAPDRGEPWRLYAVTDRPAYRPGDTVQWKVTARVQKDGRYVTPANARVRYELFDPRGASVHKGELALNAFGSAWAEFAPTTAHGLGEYRVTFEVPESAGSRIVGSAQLFRLEEYKLPEFEVTLALPLENGQPKLFAPGDRVEADLVARTYFGAPIANGDVELVVWQRPYWSSWPTPREYPWLYETQDENRWNRWNKGNQIHRVTLKTDASGRARVSFEAPDAGGQDSEYVLEARVTDASRREITSTQSVRVTQKAYAVNTTFAHQLHRPGDEIEVRFEARDANDNARAVEGKLTATRRTWGEVWRDPAGQEVRGAAVELARSADPSAPLERRAGWRLVRSGYEQEEVATGRVTTGADGRARWSFRAPKAGYYTVAWSSRDDRKQPIVSEAACFVADEDTRVTGYRSGGVEIVLDADTLKLGERVPVLVTTSSSNRWVLLTVEGERLHSFQVVHVEGSAKLVSLALGEEHVPNAWISAHTALNGDAYADVKEIVVPPVARFLAVELTPDASDVEPGAHGKLRVTTRDARGEPVPAEVTLSVVDESVLALQSEYAGDPRAFFHGQRRELRVSTRTSLESRPFLRLVRDENGRLRDQRQAWAESSNDFEAGDVSATGAGGLAKIKEESRFGGSSVRAAHGSTRGRRDAPRSVLALDAAGEKKDLAAGNEIAGASEPVVVVRSDFRETALWKPDLVTGADGRGECEFTYPESLTRWKASARAMAADARTGWANTSTRTRKPLTARLAAPRFFVAGDECVVSALLDNQTNAPLDARVELALTGLDVIAAPALAATVPANGQRRLDWKVRATAAGSAKFVLTARAGDLSDGVERRYPVHAHGIDAQVARALRFDAGELVFELELPAARQKDTSSLEVQVAPSLAVTMLDALPYLVDYPYGCTEQTMSRFLPAAIVARTLRERGLSEEEALTRVFGGIERESAEKTHPAGRRALTELAAITRASLERLADFQHGDGGWGWWKEGDSDRWMSAYVVWGLALARDAGLDVDRSRLERGAEYLKRELVEAEQDADMQAWMLHALAAWSKDARASDHVEHAIQNVWARRDELNAYGRALFALACQGFGRTDRARTMLDNLLNGVKIDAAADTSRIDRGAAQHHAAASKTAHWGADGIGWRWTDSSVETTACALRALVAIDPQHELVSPVMTWLVQNRRGAQWSNTRDTALVVLALNEYLSHSGELGRDVEYELSVNGKALGRTKLSAQELLRAPGRFTLDARDLRDGPNEVRVKLLSGSGPLYVSARANFFSLEEPIPARGSQLFVVREYTKLESRPTLLKGPAYDARLLADGGQIRSGDRIEVVLTVEAKNDLEYLLFEDQKPAGFESVETKSGGSIEARELKSGEVDHRFEAAPSNPDAPRALAGDPARYTGRVRAVHQELRDRNVALFVDKLPQGVWEVRYTLRAEAPGRFHALPVLGQAMYVPEVRCNGAEVRVTVEERESIGG